MPLEDWLRDLSLWVACFALGKGTLVVTVNGPAGLLGFGDLRAEMVDA